MDFRMHGVTIRKKKSTIKKSTSHLMEIRHCVEKICLQGLVQVTSSKQHFQHLAPEVHCTQDNS
jgi:hypothetical protein